MPTADAAEIRTDRGGAQAEAHLKPLAPAAGPIIAGGARQGWNENDLWGRVGFGSRGDGNGGLRVRPLTTL